MIRKITDGFVVQYYTDDGSPYSQEFISGDISEWEKDDGEFGDCIESPETRNKFRPIPFSMVQPRSLFPTLITEIESVEVSAK